MNLFWLKLLQVGKLEINNMKIELTCRENEKYLRKTEVYALRFDLQSKTFIMPYCLGDSWGLEMRCPMATPPTSFQFQWDRVSIHFARQEEADSFCAWLIEGEEKAKDGYRTMRG